MGIRFANESMEHIFQWLGGSKSIESGLKDENLYKRSAAQLRERKLMFIDQIVDPRNKMLLSWQIIKGIGAGSNKGRTPKWYETLNKKMTNETGELSDELNKGNWMESENSYSKFYQTPSEDRRIKEWCSYRDKRNNIHWRKIKQKEVNGDKDKWQLYHLSRKK